jgi:hypothetical protein
LTIIGWKHKVGSSPAISFSIAILVVLLVSARRGATP